MPNKVNLLEFQDVLRRATLNFSIDNVGLSFTKEKFRVGMRSSNAIVILNGENHVISGIQPTDSWDLNFSDPSKNVKAYFDLIIPDENDEAIIQMTDAKITIKSGSQKTNLFFCSDHLVTKFDREGPRQEGEMMYEDQIVDNFVDTFNLVKKVAGGFGKIYFNTEDGDVSIESTDKTNAFSNGLKMSIGVSDYDDASVCFDFKTINNVMTLLGGDATDFSFRIGYMPSNNGGMASFIKNDGSEKYYVLSMRENV